MRHDVSPSDEMRDIARRAVAACDYRIGAVDLLLNSTGNIYTLEVNLRPGLSPYTTSAYTRAISRLVSNNNHD
jgi:D-alanine-D-alanine ligase-like ATP-grasp enzyme